jgi:FhuF-like iron-sulfur protein
MRMTSVLAEVGGWGPFFAVRTGVPAAAGWRPVRGLLDDPDVLAGRVDAVRAHLGRVPVRVAASVAHLGICARLVSPALGAAVRTGRFPAFGPDDAWWQGELSGAFPLTLRGRSVTTPAGLLDLLGELVEATAAYSVSRRVLWGNVASAVNGAATMIGVARPDLAARAVTLADGLLARPPLAGTGGRAADGRFRRHSCCLIYRAGQAVCGDCVLRAD